MGYKQLIKWLGIIVSIDTHLHVIDERLRMIEKDIDKIDIEQDSENHEERLHYYIFPVESKTERDTKDCTLIDIKLGKD